MSSESLADVLESVENPIDRFRNIESGSDNMTFPGEGHFPEEHTNWIEEQRAWRESVILADQSYHMVTLHVRGPDALRMYSDIAVNSLRNFETGDPPQAKQLVSCNPNGYVIGDGTFFYLDDEEFLTVGLPPLQNWIQYNADTGNYDVSADQSYSPHGGNLPTEFRYEIQGPNAFDVLEEVIDGGVPNISFFEMDEITIDGREVYVLGHGMAGEAGLEIFGDYEDGEPIEEAILDVGKEYGIRQLGSKSYRTTVVEVGWISRPLPAIYTSDELADYRQWLGDDSYEANLALSGSFQTDDITDYYLYPSALGYDRLVNFDHEFVGRDALEAAEPGHTKVTLLWDAEDIIDVYASLFEEGESYKYIDLPDPRNLGAKNQYDAVLADGETVGLSISPKYDYNERAILSLCPIDAEYAEPGTEVTVVWGEENVWRESDARHVQTEIDATVAPAPYLRGREEI